MRKTSYLLLLLFSTTLLSQNLTKTSNRYCFYADASEKIVGTFTPAAWTIWGMVNAILPVIAEIVIAVVMAKMKTSTAVDPLPTTTIPITTDAETIQQTAGNSWGLTIAYGLRSDRFARASDLVARKMGWASSTDASATPANTGTPNDTLSLGVLAIINTVFYIVEKYLRAECDYENQ